MAHRALLCQTWEALQPEIPEGASLRDGAVLDAQTIWICTAFPGAVIRSEDGGINWEVKLQEPHTNYFHIQFVDSLHGWLLKGEELSSSPPYDYTLWRTSDGGNSWDQVSDLPEIRGGSSYTGIHFLDSLRGFAGWQDTI